MTRAVLVTINNRTGQLEILTAGSGSRPSFALTPEGLTAFARTLQRLSPIASEPHESREPSYPDLSKLTQAQIESDPNYNKYLMPMNAKGLGRTSPRKPSWEDLDKIMSNFTLED